MEIRDLKAKDVKTLAKMLGKLKPESIEGVLSLVKGGEVDPMKVGLSLFHIIAADLTDDIYAWLADLIGKKPAELDGMAFNTPADIIKALVSRGDFGDFFGLATRQAGTAKSSPEVGTQSNAATDGQIAK